MPLNIEPIDRNQRTAFQEREALRNKVNEIIETIGPMEISWDAVPTTGHGVGYAVTSEGIKASVDNEASSRANQDTALGTRISGEETARANQDTALGTRISGEETARANQDTALQTAIDTEQGTRASEDVSIRGDIAALGTRVTTEQTARANQDTALGTRIDGKQNTLTQGTGITIENDVISATGISVVAGTGINISGNVISQSNIRFVRNAIPLNAAFFTNIENRLTNNSPFTLMMRDTTTTTPTLTLLTFNGNRATPDDICIGNGFMAYSGNIYSIYEINGLASSRDDITIKAYNINLTGMDSITISKNDLIASEGLEGYFNLSLV